MQFSRLHPFLRNGENTGKREGAESQLCLNMLASNGSFLDSVLSGSQCLWVFPRSSHPEWSHALCLKSITLLGKPRYSTCQLFSFTQHRRWKFPQARTLGQIPSPPFVTKFNEPLGKGHVTLNAKGEPFQLILRDAIAWGSAASQFRTLKRSDTDMAVNFRSPFWTLAWYFAEIHGFTAEERQSKREIWSKRWNRLEPWLYAARSVFKWSQATAPNCQNRPSTNVDPEQVRRKEKNRYHSFCRTTQSLESLHHPNSLIAGSVRKILAVNSSASEHNLWRGEAGTESKKQVTVPQKAEGFHSIANEWFESIHS
jgi:hypothetical protein